MVVGRELPATKSDSSSACVIPGVKFAPKIAINPPGVTCETGGLLSPARKSH